MIGVAAPDIGLIFAVIAAAGAALKPDNGKTDSE